MDKHEIVPTLRKRNPAIGVPGIFPTLAAGVALFVGTGWAARTSQAVGTVPEDAIVITNGTVIAGTGGDAVHDGMVVIRGDRIVGVGPRSEFDVPSTARIIDALGGSVLPGIINAHVHHAGPVEQRRRFLEEGVTSVCDLGSPTEEWPGFADTRTEHGLAARGFFAGSIITAPGGYPDGLHGTTGFNREAETAIEARLAVTDLLGQGASFIKIALDPSWDFAAPLPVLDSTVTRAIVDEAHSRGVRVRSHQIQAPYYPASLKAGIDVAEHLPFPTGWPPEEEILRLMETADPLRPFFEGSPHFYDSMLTSMAEARVAMVPTVSTLLGPLYGKKERTQREEFLVMAILEMVRRFADAGGVVAVGNDFNDHSVNERLPLREMKALRDAGLAPLEVVEASTRHGAYVCGQEAELGTLEPGKLADIVIVNGDPLIDLDAMREVRTVIVGGVVAHQSPRPAR